MPDIDDLTYFEVVRTVSPVPAGVLTADVVFEAQVARGFALQADVSPDVVEVLSRPVHARLVGGTLMKNGTPGVELLSAAEVAVDGGLAYLVTFDNARVDGAPLRNPLRPLIFDAPDGGTFDLKDAAPFVEDATVSPTVRGPRGFSVTAGVFDDDGNLVLENADGSHTSPIERSPGTLTLVDNADGTVSIG